MANEKTQLAELQEAVQEGRQPNCVACGNPLLVRLYASDYFYWLWDSGKQHYVRDQDHGDGEAPTCEACGNADWAYLDDGEPHQSLGLTY